MKRLLLLFVIGMMAAATVQAQPGLFPRLGTGAGSWLANGTYSIGYPDSSRTKILNTGAIYWYHPYSGWVTRGWLPNGNSSFAYPTLGVAYNGNKLAWRLSDGGAGDLSGYFDLGFFSVAGSSIAGRPSGHITMNGNPTTGYARFGVGRGVAIGANIPGKHGLDATGLGLAADTIIAPLRVVDTTSAVKLDTAMIVMEELYIGPFQNAGAASGRMGRAKYILHHSVANANDESDWRIVSDTVNGVIPTSMVIATNLAGDGNFDYAGPRYFMLRNLPAGPEASVLTTGNGNGGDIFIGPTSGWNLSNVLLGSRNPNGINRYYEIQVDFFVSGSNTSGWYIKFEEN